MVLWSPFHRSRSADHCLTLPRSESYNVTIGQSERLGSQWCTRSVEPLTTAHALAGGSAKASSTAVARRRRETGWRQGIGTIYGQRRNLPRTTICNQLTYYGVGILYPPEIHWKEGSDLYGPVLCRRHLIVGMGPRTPCNSRDGRINMGYYDSREVREGGVHVDLNDRTNLGSRNGSKESLPLVSVLDDYVYDMDRWAGWRSAQISTYGRATCDMPGKQLSANRRSRRQSWDTLRSRGGWVTGTATTS